MHQVNTRHRVVCFLSLNTNCKRSNGFILWPWRNSWKCNNYENMRITAFPERTGSDGETRIRHQKNWCQKILPWVELPQESLSLCWQLVALNSAHFSSKSRKAVLIQPHLSFKILDFRIDTEEILLKKVPRWNSKFKCFHISAALQHRQQLPRCKPAFQFLACVATAETSIGNHSPQSSMPKWTLEWTLKQILD